MADGSTLRPSDRPALAEPDAQNREVYTNVTSVHPSDDTDGMQLGML